MNNSFLLHSSPSVTKKINSLYKLLVKEKLLFEEVAGTVTDNALRCTLLSVAQQNNQYAEELSALMQSTRTVNKAEKKKSDANKTAAGLYKTPDSTLAALHVCNSNERKIITAYRRLLKENNLYDGLRQMMRYQSEGIMFACTQLKLLRSLSRNSKYEQGLVH